MEYDWSVVFFGDESMEFMVSFVDFFKVFGVNDECCYC